MIGQLKDEISIYSEALELRRSILCIICLEPYSDPVVLPCSHTFCRQCILAAFNSKKKCPVCSAKTSKRSIQSSTFIQPVVKLVSELIDSLTKDGRYSVRGAVLENHYKKHQVALNSKPLAQQSQIKISDQQDSIQNTSFDEIQLNQSLIANESEKVLESGEQLISISSNFPEGSNLLRVPETGLKQDDNGNNDDDGDSDDNDDNDIGDNDDATNKYDGLLIVITFVEG
jgi:hypothetical protein